MGLFSSHRLRGLKSGDQCLSGEKPGPKRGVKNANEANIYPYINLFNDIVV